MIHKRNRKINEVGGSRRGLRRVGVRKGHACGHFRKRCLHLAGAIVLHLNCKGVGLVIIAYAFGVALNLRYRVGVGGGGGVTLGGVKILIGQRKCHLAAGIVGSGQAIVRCVLRARQLKGEFACVQSTAGQVLLQGNGYCVGIRCGIAVVLYNRKCRIFSYYIKNGGAPLKLARRLEDKLN